MNIYRSITLRSLKKNKSRTIATIIGVVIFVICITGIFSFYNTASKYKVDKVKERSGSWGIGIENLDNNQLRNLKLTDGFEYGTVRSIGYAMFNETNNQEKPYYFIASFDDNMYNLANVDIVAGRKPLSPNEILVPEHIFLNRKVSLGIGDIMDLAVGSRVNISTGTEYGLFDKISKTKEAFIPTRMKKYKVVGICKRPTTEPYMAAGYTLITKDNSLNSDLVYTYVDSSFYKNVNNLIEKGYINNNKIAINEDLLSSMGLIPISNEGLPIGILAAILTFLIFIGAVMLLYNAFNNTVVERKKMYSTMSTVGATGYQMKWFILYEGFIYGILSIPLGIAGGTLIVKVFISVLNNFIEPFKNSGIQLEFIWAPKMYLGVLCIVVFAIFISLARPLDIITMAKPIYIEDEKKKAVIVKRFEPPVILELFFESSGYLAGKTFGRDRNRYKATIVSLSLSIVLLMTASNVTHNIRIGTDQGIGDNGGYDIVYRSESYEEAEAAFMALQGAEGVTDSIYYYSLLAQKNKSIDSLEYEIVVVDDDSMRDYLEKNEISTRGYFDINNPKCVAMENMKIYDSSASEYKKIRTNIKTNTKLNIYINGERQSLSVGVGEENFPNGVSITPGKPILVISEIAAKNLNTNMEMLATTARASFKTNDPEDTFSSMQILCRQKYISTDGLINIATMLSNTKNMLLIINILTYGFVGLLFVVALANVINTLSTNLDRRKMEFSTYLTIGMTKKDFNKMLCVESMLIGSTALKWGLPFGIIGTYVTYRLAENVDMFGYVLPWKGMLMSIVVIFLVVTIVSLYSIGKIKLEKVSDFINAYKL